MVDNIPVYIFSTQERTKDLCVYSYKKLGFENVVVLEGSSSFKDKYIEFAEHASSSGLDYFIRADADLIPFDGILKIVSKIKSGIPYWIEGQYFDYFMNKRRHGTPHLIPKVAVDVLANNYDIISNSKKPESEFSRYLVNNDLVKLKSVKVITSLHEYEQYPSKVCNSFLNRLKRSHRHLYDLSFIENYAPEIYKQAIKHAIDIYNSGNLEHPDSMNFLDFSDLDIGFSDISDHQLSAVYTDLKYIYSLVNRIV